MLTGSRVRHLPAAEPHRRPHLVALVQELVDVAGFDLEVVLSDLGAEPHPLDVTGAAMTAAALFLLLVLVLAIVNDPHTGGTDVGATSTRSSSASAAFTSASRTPMTPSCSPLGPMTRTSRALIFSFTLGSRSMLPLLPPLPRHDHAGTGRCLRPEKTQRGRPQPSPAESLAPSLQTGATSCIGR